MRERFEAAVAGRLEIHEAPDDVTRAIQEVRFRQVESRLDNVRLIANAIVATFFSAEKPRAREAKRQEIESWANGPAGQMWPKLERLTETLRSGAQPITPFHWEIEFPEVFARENGGFDAIVGNPPFMRGKAVGTSLGPAYRDWLKITNAHSNSSADIVAFFFRRAFDILCPGGTFGLIATKTICEGDTRHAGLRFICTHGGKIYRATRRLRWPGTAAVSVSTIHVVKGDWAGPIVLDGVGTKEITAFLFEHGGHEDPARLAENAKISFNGCGWCWFHLRRQ